MNSNEKTKYRRTKAWIEFRERLIRERGCYCELLGVKVNPLRIQVHHLDPADYKNLDPARFVLLSPSAHDFVEHVAKILDGNKTKIPNKEIFLDWIWNYLPKGENTAKNLMNEINK